MDTTTEETAGEGDNSFHWVDYLIFGISLAISLGIGVFFGIRDRNTKSTEEFLMGGRSQHWIPVGLSLLVSILNGVFIIGVPAEVHYYGPVHMLLAVGLTLTCIFVCIFFIPTFRNMNITSAYEVRNGAEPFNYDDTSNAS